MERTPKHRCSSPLTEGTLIDAYLEGSICLVDVAKPSQSKDTTGGCRWGQDQRTGLSSEAPPVARVEFLEWTGANHLRHAKFAGLAGHPRYAVVSLGEKRCLADAVALRQDELVFGLMRRDGQ